MAFRWDGSTGFLAQTAAPLPSNNWTMCCWIRPASVPVTFDTYLSAGNTTAIVISLGYANGAFGICDEGGTVVSAFPTQPKVGEWWFIALAHNGATSRGWGRRFDWRSLQHVSQAHAAVTLTSMRFGNSTFDGTDFSDGRAAGLRIWSRQLSTAELLKESFSLLPVSRARLYACGQENSLVDLSGFGRKFTQTGTVTKEPGPPVNLRGNQTVILDHVNDPSSGGTIVSAGIASAEAIGQPGVSVTIVSAGIASSEIIGQPAVVAVVASSGIASAEAIGQPAVVAAVNSAGIASAEAIGQPAVVAVVAPTGIASAEAIGQPSVAAAVSSSGIASAETIGQPDVIAVINGAGIASGEAFGQPIVGTGNAVISDAGGIASDEAIGQPDLAVVIASVGIASAESIGQPSVIPEVGAVGIASAESLGAPSVAATIESAGIASAEAVGQPTVAQDGIILSVGIPSDETFGRPVLTLVGGTDVEPVPAGMPSGGGAGGGRKQRRRPRPIGKIRYIRRGKDGQVEEVTAPSPKTNVVQLPAPIPVEVDQNIEQQLTPDEEEEMVSLLMAIHDKVA